ncbi:MAG: SAM-dependent methyltransferase [Sutterellaceae bacterium]|nr:SAM-dependent methyltransferase [Sutterellaceae bacterium]
MSGILYLLPNRITEAAEYETLPQSTLTVAKSCTRFLAENAKSARAFLKDVGHPKPIAELEIVEIGHVPDTALFDLWLKPLLDGVDTAIVSESGCPGVADPGAGLVLRAHELGIAVKPLVGPCSILLTLMASGMNGQRFRFLGYLPIHDDERAKTLKVLEIESRKFSETELFIETPYRNNKMLSAMIETLADDTLITVATDVTGNEESLVTKSVKDWRKTKPELPKLPTVFALLGTGRARGEVREHKPTLANKPKIIDRRTAKTAKPGKTSRYR